MDNTLRILINRYKNDSSPENAILLAEAVLRSTGASDAPQIPHNLHGYLTYAGLLDSLLKMNDSVLASTVTVLPSTVTEYLPVIQLTVTPEDDDVLPDQLVLETDFEGF